MAKKAYIGVNNVARQIKKGYFGVSGKARRIKKAYIGIGGVARPFLSSELEYYGTITPLSEARERLGATTVGNYALFAGGDNGESSSATVDAYNKSLTRSTPTPLSEAFGYTQAASVGNYALFVKSIGHDSGAYEPYLSTVNAYNTSLTRSIPETLSQTRASMGVASNDNYALFVAGVIWIYNNSSVYNVFSRTIDYYNKSLTRSTSSISDYTGEMAGVRVGEYALIGGGFYEPNSTTGEFRTEVYAFNNSLTSTQLNLSKGRTKIATAMVGNYALFAGGEDHYSLTNVEAFNTSLTRTSVTSLSKSRYDVIGGSVGDFAIFAGGQQSNVIDVYNTSLTRTIPNPVPEDFYWGTSATIGNYALFGGGRGSYGGIKSTVHAFTA